MTGNQWRHLPVASAAALFALGCTGASQRAAAQETESAARNQGESLRLPTTGSLGEVPGEVDLPDSASRSDRLLGGQRFGARRGAAGGGVAVLDRRRPDYDPQGIRAGGFELFPLIGLSANATNNVFRQNDGVGDVFLLANAEVVARSDWARHQVSLGANVSQRAFAKYTSEDTTTYAAKISGDLEIGSSLGLNLGGSFRHDFSDRTSVDEVIITRSPVRFDAHELTAGLTFGAGRLAARVQGTYEKRDYQNARSLSGAVLNQNFRDVQSYEVRAEVGYEIGPGRQLYVSGGYEDRNFRLLSTPDRNVEIVELLAGLNSEITPLIRGRFALGYIDARFRGPGIPSRSGLAVDVQLTYLFSELTTFSLRARRTISNASLPNAPASFLSQVTLGADHELLRNVILSGSLLYNRGDYVDDPLLAETYGATLGARWLINRRWRLTSDFAVRRSTSNSAIAPRASETFTGKVGVVFQL